MNLIKRKEGIKLLGVVLGLVLVSMLSLNVALAQSQSTDVSGDIPSELVSLAEELGCQTSAECAQKFDADIETGINLAQKYNVYDREQEQLATTFKTEVLERLRTVSQDNFEEEILELANKILSEKPALARIMDVTRQKVDAAETIVSTVKKAGVNIQTCQKSPEDLSRDQLIACVKASNDLSDQRESLVDYIPRDNVRGEDVTQMLALESALLDGEYPELGRISIDEVGDICLRPGSESITSCDRIAEKFFGPKGVEELQAVRQQRVRIEEYYTEGVKRLELVAPDGRRIVGKNAIKNACDVAFERNDIGLARACGDFAVRNGYSTQEEVQDGLSVLESFSRNSRGVNFDNCRFDPESCRDFLPDEFRSRFDAENEIFRIMSDSIGFDPSRCENTFDSEIGKRCFEGAKKALGRVEEIARNNPDAQKIVDEIKFHIDQGDQMTDRLDEFNQDSKLREVAGPGGCQGPRECFEYCNQPGNTAECISFGAQRQIFNQDTVVEKFNIVNDRLTDSVSPYPVFSDPREVRVDEDFNFRPFPDSYRPREDPGLSPYPFPDPSRSPNPAGPSPECFAAISSGDFARAKEFCSSVTDTYKRDYPEPVNPPFPICPDYMPSQCPVGQMREAASDANNCPVYGACIPIEDYRPIDSDPLSPRDCAFNQYWNGNTCLNSPVTEQCPSGQYWFIPPTGGPGYCQTDDIYSTNSSTACTGAGGIWDASSNYCQMPDTENTTNANCSSNQWWDSFTQSCQSFTPTVDSCDYSTQYWKASTSQCLSKTNCTDANNSDYNSSECRGVRNVTTTPLSTSGCGSFGAQATCQATPGCGWANGACGGTMTTTNTANSSMNGCFYPNATKNGSSLGWTVWCESDYYNCHLGDSSGDTVATAGLSLGAPSSCANDWITPDSNISTDGCPAGYHSHSENGGFCINDQENYSGICYDSAGTSMITCPQANYTDYTCPSGQYWYAPPAGGAGYCQTSATDDAYSADPSTACSQAGGTWSSNYCQMPNMTDTADPSTACSQAGGTWSNNYCQMPNMTDTYNSTSCSSDQYWDGTACMTTTPYDTPPADNYVPPEDTYTPPPADTYVPPADNYVPPEDTYVPPPADTPPPPPPPPPEEPAAMSLCNQLGGNWTGLACNLATNASDQRAYNAYFQSQSDTLVAQSFKALLNLFR